MTTLTIKLLPVGSLKPYDRNARTHSAKQIAQIAALSPLQTHYRARGRSWFGCKQPL
jgi:hypothetical protein